MFIPRPQLHKADIELKTHIDRLTTLINNGKISLPVVSTAPSDTNKDSAGEVRLVDTGSTQEVHFLINEVWYKVSLTPA